MSGGNRCHGRKWSGVGRGEAGAPRWQTGCCFTEHRMPHPHSGPETLSLCCLTEGSGLKCKILASDNAWHVPRTAKNRSQSQECGGGGGDFNQNDSNGPFLELFHFSLSELTPQKCLLQDTYGYIPHPLQGLLEQLP